MRVRVDMVSNALACVSLCCLGIPLSSEFQMIVVAFKCFAFSRLSLMNY